MAKKGKDRLNVLLTFDVDADSSVRGPYSGRPDEPVARSKGQFGPKVGLPKILNLLDKYAIKTTFFVPGWTAETYPGNVKEIVRRGHEVGVHGYKHENLAQLNSQRDEIEIFRKSIGRLGFWWVKSLLVSEHQIGNSARTQWRIWPSSTSSTIAASWIVRNPT